MFCYTWNSGNFFIIQCVLAICSLPNANFAFAKELQNGQPQITAAQFYAELGRESADFRFYHLETTFMISGYGDRLYNMAEDIGAECRLTAKAVIRMLEQLEIFEEVDAHLKMATNATLRDIEEGGADLKRHPAELECEKVEKLFAQNPNLGAAFDRAKMAAKNSTGGGGRRPPYSEVARSMASEMFRHQLKPSAAYSRRHHLFAKCVVAVARNREFGDTMQGAYEKTLDEITPQVAKRAELATMFLSDGKTLWFLPQMTRIFYGLIEKNLVLKKEFDSTVAILGRDFEKENLEFSTL